MKGRYLVFGVFGVVAVIFLVSLIGVLSDQSDQPPQPSPPSPAQIQQEAEEKARKLADTKQQVLTGAQEAIANEDYEGASKILGRVPWLQGDPDVAALQAKAVKEEERTRPQREARQARERAATDKLARQAYGEVLRTKFLDDGLDIKVQVKGQEAERLDLHFVLFNDVWTHNFKKGSLVGEIKRMGFKRVDLRDGYDYHVYFTFK